MGIRHMYHCEASRFNRKRVIQNYFLYDNKQPFPRLLASNSLIRCNRKIIISFCASMRRGMEERRREKEGKEKKIYEQRRKKKEEENKK